MHSPAGLQQDFSPAEGNMKYCEQDRQPPHSKVAVSITVNAQLASFFNIPAFSG